MAIAEKKEISKKSKKKQLLRGGFDLPFFILVMILLMFGLVMMFSASYVNAYYNFHDSYYYIKKQIFFALVGIIVMYIVSKVDYHLLHKFVWPIVVITYALLVVVLFLPKIAHVKRWIVIGPINIQPSEIAKFAIAMLFAHLISLYASKSSNKMKTFRYGVLPFILVLASISGLMLLEPHLSGTILILGIGFTLMFVGGTSLKWFAAGGALAGSALFVMVIGTTFISYAKSRLTNWLDPFSDPLVGGWQTIQSLYAIGSGGIMGLGLGNSRQKYLYIPESQNDFVFPIVCEELGLVGAVIVIILFALLVWRGYVIAMRAPDKFGSLLAVGLITQVGLQAMLNIAVTTNTVPNTGISLPFFSSGGSSLMMLLFEMGIIMSISRFSSVEQT
jgi:cell division protein FtsW